MADIAKRAGITRQALYLHFPTRAELLIAVTFHVDEIHDSDARLARSRSARTGEERLEAFIDAWSWYLPRLFRVAKALMTMGETDEAAAGAWSQRMSDMREGCQAAIDALKRDGKLSDERTAKQSTDLLWTMLSVPNWEYLTVHCGWSQKAYRAMLQETARTLFVKA